eukprot:gene48423-64965_t
MHAIGARQPFEHRRTLDSQTFGHAPRQRLIDAGFVHADTESSWLAASAQALAAVDAAQKSKSPPPPGGGAAAAKAAAGLQPEPIKSMLETLADAGANQSRTAERQGLSAEIKPVAEQCGRTIAGRFPFAAGSKADVLPDDFGQMFGVGGQLDDFFQRRLAPLVDVGANPWAFKPLPDGTRPPGGAALADFQRAAKIREAFFRGGGKQPGFKVDVRVVEMAEGLKEVNLDVDGQVAKFTAGNTAAQTLSWPSTKVASQIKLSGPAGSAPQLFEGPWALFRLFSQFEVQPSPQPEKFTVVLTVMPALGAWRLSQHRVLTRRLS